MEHAWKRDGLDELQRPCLRHLDLEVEVELVDPELSDPWFASGERDPDLVRAREIVSLGGIAIDDDVYLPETRSYRLPIAIGVGLAAAAALLVVF